MNSRLLPLNAEAVLSNHRGLLLAQTFPRILYVQFLAKLQSTIISARINTISTRMDPRFQFK